MVIKIDQKSLDNGFRGLRGVLFGEAWLPGAIDTRGRYRTYSLSVHGECLAVVSDRPAVFKGILVDPAEGSADERYLKDLEGAEVRLTGLLAELRARKEEVKGRVLDRSDRVMNMLRATVIDPRTPADSRELAESLLGRIERVVQTANSAIRERARTTSTLNGRVAELESDNASLRATLSSEGDAPPPAAARGRRRRAPR